MRAFKDNKKGKKFERVHDSLMRKGPAETDDGEWLCCFSLRGKVTQVGGVTEARFGGCTGKITSLLTKICGPVLHRKFLASKKQVKIWTMSCGCLTIEPFLFMCYSFSYLFFWSIIDLLRVSFSILNKYLYFCDDLMMFLQILRFTLNWNSFLIRKTTKYLLRKEIWS